MPKLRLEVDFGNAAMRSLADALVAISVGLTRPGFRDEAEAGESGLLRDLNGNTVGKWEVVADV